MLQSVLRSTPKTVEKTYSMMFESPLQYKMQCVCKDTRIYKDDRHTIEMSESHHSPWRFYRTIITRDIRDNEK